MKKKIEEILAKRGDLSTFLVHLTSNNSPSPKNALISIIQSGQLESRSPWGIIREKDQLPESIKSKQKCVCFTETPLEFIWSLCEEIEGRDHPLSNFGIIITKKQARQKGVNPVWYIDATRGHDWLVNHINSMIDNALKSNNEDHEIFKLTPFFEIMGTWENNRKEFWWEREWRHNGNFKLPNNFITLCPEEDHLEIKSLLETKEKSSHLIDSRWSMEEMVAHLAEFDPEEIGPF